VSWRCRPSLLFEAGHAGLGCQIGPMRWRRIGDYFTRTFVFPAKSPTPTSHSGSRMRTNFPQRSSHAGRTVASLVTGVYPAFDLRTLPSQHAVGNNSSPGVPGKLFQRAKRSRTIPQAWQPNFTAASNRIPVNGTIRSCVTGRINSCGNTRPIANGRRLDRNGPPGLRHTKRTGIQSEE